MDKDLINLEKGKRPGLCSSEELFDFFEKKNFIKRKDNLPRFCEQQIQMIKFKEGSGAQHHT